MSMQKAQRQMLAHAGREVVGQGEATPDAFSDEAFCPRHATRDTGSALLQAALTTENLRRAFKRVRANKGVAGVDGLDINQTSRHLAGRRAQDAVLAAQAYVQSGLRVVVDVDPVEILQPGQP